MLDAVAPVKEGGEGEREAVQWPNGVHPCLIIHSNYWDQGVLDKVSVPLFPLAPPSLPFLPSFPSFPFLSFSLSASLCWP